MNWSGKMVFGIILLIIGANILLNILGIHVGTIFGLILSIVFVFYGYNKMKKSEKTGGRIFGMGLLIFGSLLAIGQAHKFIGLFIAAAIIYFGYQILKRETPKQEESLLQNEPSLNFESNFKMSDSFDEEWNRFLDNKKA